MNKIRPNLYVGNMQDAKVAQPLTDAGITAILNVSYENDDPVYFVKQMRYIKIGLADSSENTKYMRDLAINALVALLNEGETVLVHCSAGVSRAPFVAAQALAKIENKDPDLMLQEIRNERTIVIKGALWLDYGYKPIGAEDEV